MADDLSLSSISSLLLLLDIRPSIIHLFVNVPLKIFLKLRYGPWKRVLTHFLKVYGSKFSLACNFDQ